jgi:hypothetical protein
MGVPPPVRDAIARQLSDIERIAKAQQRRKRHFRQWFELLNVVVGLPAATLAGAATVTALEDAAPHVVAILAGAATVLSAAQLFLRSGDRAAYNRRLEAEFARLERAASRTRDIELACRGEDEAYEALLSYEAKLAELIQRAPLEQ